MELTICRIMPNGEEYNRKMFSNKNENDDYTVLLFVDTITSMTPGVTWTYRSEYDMNAERRDENGVTRYVVSFNRPAPDGIIKRVFDNFTPTFPGHVCDDCGRIYKCDMDTKGKCLSYCYKRTCKTCLDEWIEKQRFTCLTCGKSTISVGVIVFLVINAALAGPSSHKMCIDCARGTANQMSEETIDYYLNIRRNANLGGAN